MDINYKRIGERIQKTRKMRGLSVEDLAGRVHFTPKSLILAENGQANIGIDFLLPLCNALEITPNDMLEGEFAAKGGGSAEMELALDELKDLIKSIKQETEQTKSSGTVIKDTEAALEDIRQMVAKFRLEEKQLITEKPGSIGRKYTGYR